MKMLDSDRLRGRPGPVYCINSSWSAIINISDYLFILSLLTRFKVSHDIKKRYSYVQLRTIIQLHTTKCFILLKRSMKVKD